MATLAALVAHGYVVAGRAHDGFPTGRAVEGRIVYAVAQAAVGSGRLQVLVDIGNRGNRTPGCMAGGALPARHDRDVLVWQRGRSKGIGIAMALRALARPRGVVRIGHGVTRRRSRSGVKAGVQLIRVGGVDCGEIARIGRDAHAYPCIARLVAAVAATRSIGMDLGAVGRRHRKASAGRTGYRQQAGRQAAKVAVLAGGGTGNMARRCGSGGHDSQAVHAHALERTGPADMAIGTSRGDAGMDVLATRKRWAATVAGGRHQGGRNAVGVADFATHVARHRDVQR